MNVEKVLIIEDNPMNMEIASILLENVGIAVFKAEDGETGIALAQQFVPHLILMDIHLPKMDGFEISKILKNNPLTANITIVAFTALVMEEDKKKALSAGCVGFISKPIEVEHFAKTVKSYLSLQRKQLGA